MENLSPNEYIDKVIKDLKQRNRFHFNNDFKDLLDYICTKYQVTINKGESIYRARVYLEPDRFDKYHNPQNYINEVFLGFDEQKSFVNKERSKVPEGRLNGKFVPYLYAAFDLETALKEVKPYAKTAISVAKIELLEDLSIIDLCNNFGIDSNPWKAEFSMMLCSRVSEPVYDTNGYLFTQQISQYIREKQFDGVAYLSAYSDYGTFANTNKGRNITVFNYKKCRAVESTLFLVKNVDVAYKPFIK